MNAKQLLDSRKFCLLATDFAKTWLDKKASEDDKEMRLEAVLGMVGPLTEVKFYKSSADIPHVPIENIQGQAPRIQVTTLAKHKRKYTKRKTLAEPAIEQVKKTSKNGFKLEDDDAPAPKTAIGYVDQMRALRKNPNIELNKAADIVIEAIQNRGWDASGNIQVPLPKGMSIVGLEAVLRERKVAFTAFMSSMPPRNQVISDSYKDMPLDKTDSVPGGQGHRTVGWVVILTK